jgi:STE24 endopeptidase
LWLNERVNPYLVVIVTALVLRYVMEVAADVLNLRAAREELPAEFADVYDAERYRRSQCYLKDATRLGLTADTVQTAFTLLMIAAGGFNLLDRAARLAGQGPILGGLLFLGLVAVVYGALGMPFSVYSTFVIEERYGFNRTTVRTFILDILKGILLAVVIGAPVAAVVFWFFEHAGSAAWLYGWLAVSVFQVFLLFIAPYVIMPLFNKFLPLDDDTLRTAIEDYACSQRFAMRGVYKMDGSRRSSKTNAFFTGFGRSRRIVLFDTLIAKHSVAELVAIVAHEMGHYRRKHIPRAMARAILVSGMVFFLLSLFIGNRRLFDAFGMEHVSVYAGLVFFGFLYTPIGMAISLLEGWIARRQEYEADRFAGDTTGTPEAMVSALKKLSADNLSNLSPHPFKVALSYSHPPVLQRIRALRAGAQNATRNDENSPVASE